MVGTFLGGSNCAMSWCDLHVTFDLDAVTLNVRTLSRNRYQPCPGQISTTIRCRKFKLGRLISWGSSCATSWCDLDVTFDLDAVTLNVRRFLRKWIPTLSGPDLSNHKV